MGLGEIQRARNPNRPGRRVASSGLALAPPAAGADEEGGAEEKTSDAGFNFTIFDEKQGPAARGGGGGVGGGAHGGYDLDDVGAGKVRSS